MAGPARFDPFGDSFDEAFRPIFGPARPEAEGATTNLEADSLENEATSPSLGRPGTPWS